MIHELMSEYRHEIFFLFLPYHHHPWQHNQQNVPDRDFLCAVIVVAIKMLLPSVLSLLTTFSTCNVLCAIYSHPQYLFLSIECYLCLGMPAYQSFGSRHTCCILNNVQNLQPRCLCQSLTISPPHSMSIQSANST